MDFIRDNTYGGNNGTGAEKCWEGTWRSLTMSLLHKWWTKFGLGMEREKEHLGTKWCELAKLLLGCSEGRYSAGIYHGAVLGIDSWHLVQLVWSIAGRCLSCTDCQIFWKWPQVIQAIILAGIFGYGFTNGKIYFWWPFHCNIGLSYILAILIEGRLGGSVHEVSDSWLWLRSWSPSSWDPALHRAMCWQHTACLGFSLSLSAPPLLMLSLSLLK